MHTTAFQTLADPARLRIVEVLRDGALPVNEIVDRMDIHQSGVSRHLRILHDEGFVASEPDGQRRIYSLCPGRFREIDSWVTRYRILWKSRLDNFAGELERRKGAGAPAKRNRRRNRVL